MFDGISRSDAGVELERAVGRARLRFGIRGLAELHQAGALKVRFPRGEPPEAVLVNTAGGLAGGDRLSYDIAADAGARATVTTAACEKVYRSDNAAAELSVALRVGRGGRLDWLPQETIFFDRARLARRVDAELASDATLLLVEAMVFGRTERGERVRDGAFRDSWRVRRDGRLVLAEESRGEGAIADLLDRPAVLDGHCAAATLVYVAPDAGARLDSLRRALSDGEAEGGASERDGVLAARLVARDGFRLRPHLLAAIAALRDQSLPKVWVC